MNPAALKDRLAAMAAERRRREVKKRLYEAAKSSEFHRVPDGSGAADYVVNRAGERLRDYARWLDENNDITIGLLDVLVNNIVGTGIQVEPQVTTRRGRPVERINEQLRQLWQVAERELDLYQETPFCELQRLACRTWLRDGEIFTEHMQGPQAFNRRRRVPYSVRFREGEWVPFQYTQAVRPERPRVIHGIEKDEFGIVTAYHFHKELVDPLYLRFNHAFDTVRVPAERIEHLKFTRRVNQTRGVSILHGVINRLDDIKDTEDSERVAMRVAAAWTAAITRNPDVIESTWSDFLTEDGTVDDRYKDRYFDMGPGQIWDNLLPGEDVKAIGLDRPNVNLIEFLNDQMRRVCGGTGAGASSVTKRYDGTYSAQRQEMVEQDPNYKRMRNLFVSRFVMPIYERFVFWAVESGAVSVPRTVDRAALVRADYRAPGMPWIDPKKEVEADALAVEKGFKSRHMVIRERGYDPEMVDQQLKADTFKAESMAPQAAETNENDNPEADSDDEQTDSEDRQWNETSAAR